MKEESLIVDIKRNALDDGPGIRTLIFFKGCPLSCVWCQNPEAQNIRQELGFYEENCIQCKKCLEICEEKAIIFTYKYRIKREKCTLCGKCVSSCENNALKFVGKKYEIKNLIEIILQDKVFFDNSAGGVTLSGGEPLMHMNYIHELLKELKKYSIHVCVETCGYYDTDKFENLILPYIDLIYYDLKIFDPDLHLRFCNTGNKLILQNFEKLIKMNVVEILPRIPLIPNITNTRKNLLRLAEYLQSLGVQKVHLLPYNPLWLSKTAKLGKKQKYSHSEWLTKEEKTLAIELFADFTHNEF
jgi:pyruvate formate lyase activating enzyme